MKTRALALGLLVMLCDPVWAARWVEVGEDNNGSIYYVDTDSLYQIASKTIGYWQKIVYKNKNNVPGETRMWQGQKIWHSISLNGEDCNSGLRYAAYQWIYYGLQGQVLHSDSNSPLVSRSAPETVGEELHKFVCGYWQEKQAILKADPFLEQFRQEAQTGDK